MRILLAGTFAAVSLLGNQAPGVAQSSRSGAISGVVVDGTTGEPIADAIVTLMPRTGSALPADYQRRHLTDARGRFVFMQLPGEGTFQVAAAKYGYLDGAFGREGDPFTPPRDIVIANGSWAANLRVSIRRPATIAGTIRDERGEPVVGVYVRALARVNVAGRDDLAAGPVVVTDDHGRYRISGLVPGRYVVQVPSTQVSMPATTLYPEAAARATGAAVEVSDTTRLIVGRYPLTPPAVDGRSMTYAPAFHPSAMTVAEALPVTAGFGDDRAGVDITLTPVPAVQVAGVVDGPPEAFASLTLRLLPVGLDTLGMGADTAIARVDGDGTFTFLNVPPGAYILDAPLTFNELSVRAGPRGIGATVGSGASVNLPPPPGTAGWGWSSRDISATSAVEVTSTNYRGSATQVSARMALTVPENGLSGVVVRLQPGARIRGRVELEPTTPLPPASKPPRFNFVADPASGHPGLIQLRATVDAATGAFSIEGLQAADYFLREDGRTGRWRVKSIRDRNGDHTTTPFAVSGAEDITDVVVTMTDAVQTLTGAVRDRSGAPETSAIVIVFPAQASLRANTGLWSPLFASVPIQRDGTFRVDSLPAGDYVVAAIEPGDAASWRDPQFLATVERQGAPVTLGWGATTSRDLTVVAR